MAPVDLEQFYDADPRRRHSEELEFGTDWHDGGARTQVSWVEATGELYAMRDPLGALAADVIGDMTVEPGRRRGARRSRCSASSPGRDAVEAVMSGWEQAMAGGRQQPRVGPRPRSRTPTPRWRDPPAAAVARPSRRLSRRPRRSALGARPASGELAAQHLADLAARQRVDTAERDRDLVRREVLAARGDEIVVGDVGAS